MSTAVQKLIKHVNNSVVSLEGRRPNPNVQGDLRARIMGKDFEREMLLLFRSKIPLFYLIWKPDKKDQPGDRCEKCVTHNTLQKCWKTLLLPLVTHARSESIEEPQTKNKPIDFLYKPCSPEWRQLEDLTSYCIKDGGNWAPLFCGLMWLKRSAERLLLYQSSPSSVSVPSTVERIIPILPNPLFCIEGNCPPPAVL